MKGPLFFLETVINWYLEDKRYHLLTDAKKHYFEISGEIKSDHDLYESKMKMFNDWFLFNYKIDNLTPLELYLNKFEVSDDLKLFCKNVNYSIFKYLGLSFRKMHKLEDVINRKKILFDKSYPFPMILKKDLFIGRTSCFGEQPILLNGLLNLPSSIYRLLKKQTKTIRIKTELKESYLLGTEKKRSKLIHYQHVLAKNIFQE